MTLYYQLGATPDFMNALRGGTSSLAPTQAALHAQLYPTISFAPSLSLAPGAPDTALAQRANMAALGLAGQLEAVSTLPAPPPMQRGPMVVKKKDPSEARLMPFGLNSTLAAPGIAAGATDSSPIVQPQEVTKPRRWVVSDSIASDFMILSLTIGVKPQTPANAPISAEAFRHNAQFSDIDFDTCQISQQIAALVQNVGSAPRLFRSTFYAYVAR